MKKYFFDKRYSLIDIAIMYILARITADLLGLPH